MSRQVDAQWLSEVLGAPFQENVGALVETFRENWIKTTDQLTPLKRPLVNHCMLAFLVF